jgi:Flp pilus assembly protein TadD
MRAFLAFLAVALMATPASAAWHLAKSRHFIIYSNQRPAELAAFAQKLERFDAAVRSVRAMDDPPVGDGNRLTVFALNDETAVQKLMRDRSGMVYGYYLGRASGPIAVVPRKTGAINSDELRAETVFLHEYAHHLMYQVLDRPYPRWVVEGFAEFFSTAIFTPDGAVRFGAPANHRAHGVYDRNNRMEIRTVLGDSFEELDGARFEWFYARSWLMVHYLTLEPSRKGQLAAYIEGIANGAAPLDAAVAAFGDLQKLDIELDRYSRQSRFTGFSVKPRSPQLPDVQVAPLTPGASEVILHYAQLRSGTSDKMMAAVAEQVRRVQGVHPGDELVEVALAMAELEAANPAAAEAAADRAIRANPRNTDALVLKGEAIIDKARASKNSDPRPFEEARRIFIAANKVDTEDPEPLAAYYQSYYLQGIGPTRNAIAALHYASNLAPQDRSLRISSAFRFLDEGKGAEARRTLAPVAYDPHGRRSSEKARRMIAKIDAGDLKGALAVATGKSEEAAGE